MNLSSLARYLRQRWEALFFAAIWAFLSFQVVFLVYDHKELGELNSLVTQYIALNSFILYTYDSFFAAATFTLLILSSIKGPDSPFSRNVLDAPDIYYILYMIIQLIGLNILVLDSDSSRLLVLAKLILILPYVLFIWDGSTGDSTRQAAAMAGHSSRGITKPIGHV